MVGPQDVASLRRSADFVVVGAGVVGLACALELRRRHPHATVVVLDKERRLAAHASGRNSGVVHAGFYYARDSMKARLCRRGNLALHRFCEEHGVALERCGKLVVAQDEREHATLDDLLVRAAHNGVPLEKVGEDDVRRIEPRAKTVGWALYSPSTSVLDPLAVMTAMQQAALASGIDVMLATPWRGRDGSRVITSRGAVDAGFVINAAGLQALAIARAYGFGRDLQVLPFKGLYLLAGRTAPPLACHIYPVPEPDMPFLGVHLTVTPNGGSKIGPTALPAAWLESYAPFASLRGLSRFSARELVSSLGGNLRLLLRRPSLWRYAFREAAKMVPGRLVAAAAALAHGVRREDFRDWGRPGIRAQLLDLRAGDLVMDFRHEGDERSLHVLNAVSPAFTCVLPLAEWVVDVAEAR
jgi:L-2-hydroxyglutarate oxidase LhgO